MEKKKRFSENGRALFFRAAQISDSQGARRENHSIPSTVRISHRGFSFENFSIKTTAARL